MRQVNFADCLPLYLNFVLPISTTHVCINFVLFCPISKVNIAIFQHVQDGLVQISQLADLSRIRLRWWGLSAGEGSSHWGIWEARENVTVAARCLEWAAGHRRGITWQKHWSPSALFSSSLAFAGHCYKNWIWVGCQVILSSSLGILSFTFPWPRALSFPWCCRSCSGFARNDLLFPKP